MAFTVEVSMEVQFIKGKGDECSSGGFRETIDDTKINYERVPGAKIVMIVQSPKTVRQVSYFAKRDAIKSGLSSAFPGDQKSDDLERRVNEFIYGRAKIYGVGEEVSTSISTLGSAHEAFEINLRLQSARKIEDKEITGFSIRHYPEQTCPLSGDFEFNGCICKKDIDYTINELRTYKKILKLSVNIGLFPNIFGTNYFDGWLGGKLKYADSDICRTVVQNFTDIPEAFFNPLRPFDTSVYSRGPFNLVEIEF